MKERQFNGFWEVKCPHCDEIIDLEILVNMARVQAQVHKLTYNEEISVEMLTRKIADIKQIYTSVAGVRPFGVSFLIAGVDDIVENGNTSRLFMTEPSGSYWGYHAAAIGSGAPSILGSMEEEFKEASDKLDDGILFAIKNLSRITEGTLDAQMIEVAVISQKIRKLRYFC